MSNQGYYDQGAPAGNQQSSPNFQSNNPYGQTQQQQAPQQQPPYNTQPGGYAPPPGPPPQRAGTFQETDFVPTAERGEQREAMEQFEMNRTQPESTEDRDVATLQREFPGLDGSLIAAIYGDSKSLGATREMLQELASQK